MARQRNDVLVRMPADLKRNLAREVEASEGSLNDVAVSDPRLPLRRPLRRRAAAAVVAPRPAGDVLLRMPPELKERLRAAPPSAAKSTRTTSSSRPSPDGLGDSERKQMSQRQRSKERPRAERQGPRRDHRRRQLRQLAAPGRRVLQGRAGRPVRPRPHARQPRRLPRPRHRVHRRVRRHDGKVGKDLAEAIWAHPNDTIKFADVPKTGIKVSRGMTHDGIGKYLSEIVEKAPGETDDVVGILKETKTDVVVNYLPVGSEMATKWYAEQILEAGCAMVNCMPVFIAREAYWQRRFEQAGLPIIGDDIKSQVGATITHRVLTSLFRERGVHLDKTMQLNVGGNSDFLNMLERERLESKKISKTNAVTSMLDYDLGERNVHVGPSDYVPWLTDRKWAYIRMEGSRFGDVPLNVELKLEVWDSPNSAGIVIDAVRLAKLALNNGRRRRARGAELVPDEVAAEADRRTTRRTSRPSSSSSETRAQRREPRQARRPSPSQAGRRRRPALDSAQDARSAICLVTPFAWSQPHT